MDNSGVWTGNYGLSLHDVSNPDLPHIAYGETVTGTIGIPGQVKGYRFTASAGDVVFIRMGHQLGQPLSPRLRLYDQTGIFLAEHTDANTAQIQIALNSAGVYTILVMDNSGVWTGNYTLALHPPDLIDNDIVRIHFDYTNNRIDELVYKPGSNENLLDQEMNNRQSRGLGRIQNEIGPNIVTWRFTDSTAYLFYENPSYGSKNFHLRWGQKIGFEMDMEYALTNEQVFSIGEFWKRDNDDYLVVSSLDSGVVKIQVPYSGNYNVFYDGLAVSTGLRDTRYNEMLGYRYSTERLIKCASGEAFWWGESFIEGPMHAVSGSDTVVFEFAVKDTQSFHLWAGLNRNSSDMAILTQNYPNPFKQSTTIEFGILRKSPVTIRIYNIAGQRVKTLLDQEMEAGSHTIVWDGRTDTNQIAASGVYFLQMQAGATTKTLKMVLLK